MNDSKWSPNQILIFLGGLFLAAYFIPWESLQVSRALGEAFAMLGEYAQDHVLLCLVPAFFIAGAIGVFLNQQAVIKYLGPLAPKALAYGVASVSGAILAVCSCTVLPLFKGIYKKGAGLGPAISFLYSGPAISILAIILSFQVFGLQLGLARVIGAILFSLVIGLVMGFIFRKEEKERQTDPRGFQDTGEGRPLWKTAVNLASMMGILVFLNWASSDGLSPLWDVIFLLKYWIVGAFALVLIFSLWKWYEKWEIHSWLESTRDFAIQILPLLFTGVLVAGFLLGRPSHEALIPTQWVASLLGGNSILANFFASISGAFMYFATLTEVPIVQGLLGSGMGQGPALALLLAGPSLSLPSMMVIHGELGFKKAAVYVLLVIILSTVAGLIYGSMFSL